MKPYLSAASWPATLPRDGRMFVNVGFNAAPVSCEAWMTAAQARDFAAALLRAADRADAGEWECETVEIDTSAPTTRKDDR